MSHEERQPTVRERKLRQIMSQALHSGPMALWAKPASELAALIRSTKLRTLAEGYDPTRDGGRLVAGPTGTGKSVAGVAIIRRLAELEASKTEEPFGGAFEWDPEAPDPAPPLLFVRALDLPRALLESGLGKGEPELVRFAAETRFLVLDDVGWESKRASAGDVVVEVVARRYDAGLPTYVTTGKRLDEFVEAYGDAVARRICETGGRPGKTMDLWSERRGG